MPDQNSINDVALDALRRRIIKALPNQIRTCIEELSEEQLWWRPNEKSNSVGNLVLHVSGSMQHFLCRAVGGFAYERDRPAEFSERGPMPKTQLLAIFEATITKAALTFDTLTPARLAEPSTEPNFNSIVFEDLLGVAVHLATHTGQIIYITKMLKAGALDEIWMKAHTEAGAWKGSQSK